MTIDLKWGLPFVLPFVILLLVRALFIVAGAEWSDPLAAAMLSTLIGVLVGFMIFDTMRDDGVEWNVTIGGKRNG